MIIFKLIRPARSNNHLASNTDCNLPFGQAKEYVVAIDGNSPAGGCSSIEKVFSPAKNYHFKQQCSINFNYFLVKIPALKGSCIHF